MLNKIIAFLLAPLMALFTVVKSIATKLKVIIAVFSASLFSVAHAAFDPAATVTELGAAETSVLAIFAAMIPVIVTMFVISKVRQLAKA